MSPSGEGGFPGEVLIEAIYTVDPSENKIMIQYNVVTDIESTPINLTNHAYFNLAGDNSKTKIYEHDLKLNSNKYLDFNPVDVTGNTFKYFKLFKLILLFLFSKLLARLMKLKIQNMILENFKNLVIESSLKENGQQKVMITSL